LERKCGEIPVSPDGDSLHPDGCDGSSLLSEGTCLFTYSRIATPAAGNLRMS